MDVRTDAPPACAVAIVDTLPAGTYLYARTRPASLLIARTWWATLTPTARYATLVTLAHQGEGGDFARLPPLQLHGRGQQVGRSELADMLAALPPATWQALVDWRG